MTRPYLILILLFCTLCPAVAQRQRRGQLPKVSIQVLQQKVSPSASLTDDLVEMKIRITNDGENPIPYTNNRFVLKDSKGGSHLVSRPWYPQGSQLAPGESVEVDRVFFEIPKKTKPAELSLMFRRRQLATVKL